MKTKLLFTAALMAAAGMVAHNVYAEMELSPQAVVAAEGEGEGTSGSEGTDEAAVTLPEALKAYDFNSENEEIALGHGATNQDPTYTDMLEAKVLHFTSGIDNNEAAQAYASIPNPFKGTDVEGVTISLWVYRENDRAGGIWAFKNEGAEQALFLSADSWLCYNKLVQGEDSWVDFHVDASSIPVRKMAMVTVTMNAEGYAIYVDGERMKENITHGKDLNVVYADCMQYIKNSATFCLGKRSWNGPSLDGSMDNLMMYGEVLTAEQVKKLYDTQKTENWTDFATAKNNLPTGQTLDVTYLMNNASCVSNYGWERSQGNGQFYNVNDGKLNSDTYKGVGIEFYKDNPAATDVDMIYQTINGLPAGDYKVKAYVVGRMSVNDGGVGQGLNLVVNDKSVAVESDVWGEVEVTGSVTNNGILKIALHATEQNTNIWAALANVRLEYTGATSVSTLKTIYEDKITERQTLASSLEGKIPTGYWATLSEGVDEELSEESEYLAAIKTAEDQIEMANAMVEPYAAYQTLLAQINSDLDKSTGDRKTLDEVLNAQNTAVNEATTVAGIDAARVALLEGYQTYQKTAIPTDGNYVDLTFRLKNPTCQENSGWERVSENQRQYNGNTDGRTGVESFTLSATFKNQNIVWQKVEGLQPGKYRFTALALGRQTGNGNQNVGDELYLFANENEKAVTGNSWTKIEVEGLVVDNEGTLTIGIKAAADNMNNWMMITDAHLYYLGKLGDDETEAGWLKTALAGKQDQAEKFATKHNGEITAGCSGVLNQSLTVEQETVALYRAAINEKAQQMANAYAIIAPYAAFNALKSEANFARFLRETTASPESESAIDAALSASVEDVETVKGMEDAIATLKEAQATYIANVTGLAEGVAKTDVTFFVQQTDFTGNRTAWTREAVSSGNLGFMNPNASVLGRDIRFIESYIAPAYKEEDLTGADVVKVQPGQTLISQEIAGLPKGRYLFSAAAFRRQANFPDGTAIPNVGTPADVYLYINNAETAVNSEIFTEDLFSVETVATDGTVAFGLKAGDGFNTSWHGLADVHLYYEGSAVVLDENDATAPEEGTYNKVEVRRVLKADKWNTFCVPFDMTAEQLDAYRMDVRVLSGASVVDDHATLTFDKVTAIEAGKPYIVKVSEEVSEIKVNGVAISSAMNNIDFDESGITITMKGNYSATTLNNNEFFISNNVFYVADPEAKVSLKGFRAYIEIEAETPVTASVNRMLIDIDGVTTSVEEVLGSDVLGESLMVDVYSLSGVKLKGGVKASEALEGLPKGIYVVGGKKVIK